MIGEIERKFQVKANGRLVAKLVGARACSRPVAMRIRC